MNQKAEDTSILCLFFDKLFDSVNGSYDKVVDGHHQLWRESLKVLDTMYFVNPVSKERSKPQPPTLKDWVKTIKDEEEGNLEKRVADGPLKGIINMIAKILPSICHHLNLKTEIINAINQSFNTNVEECSDHQLFFGKKIINFTVKVMIECPLLLEVVIRVCFRIGYSSYQWLNRSQPSTTLPVSIEINAALVSNLGLQIHFHLRFVLLHWRRSWSGWLTSWDISVSALSGPKTRGIFGVTIASRVLKGLV
ncbi:hypothetical protein AGLY_012152 [Aphis glycines]|uniref:Uncharacterized protein n=1 Tax=Aphis glycines TaxID=307491 RepID=A0A6G0T992_APHGL|nr:hypothetical protein AGLY_012152 [Aphis glycines]